MRHRYFRRAKMEDQDREFGIVQKLRYVWSSNDAFIIGCEACCHLFITRRQPIRYRYTRPASWISKLVQVTDFFIPVSGSRSLLKDLPCMVLRHVSRKTFLRQIGRSSCSTTAGVQGLVKWDVLAIGALLCVLENCNNELFRIQDPEFVLKVFFWKRFLTVAILCFTHLSLILSCPTLKDSCLFSASQQFFIIFFFVNYFVMYGWTSWGKYWKPSKF